MAVSRLLSSSRSRPIRIMPPRRSASEVEVAASKMQKAAYKMQSQASSRFVEETMKDKPDLVSSIVRHLKSLGVVEKKAKRGAGAVKNEMSGSEQEDEEDVDSVAPSCCRKRKLKLSDTPSSESSATLDMVASPPAKATAVTKGQEWQIVHDVLPKRYVNYTDIPPHYWKHMLTLLEPVSLSAGNIRGLTGSQKKHVPKEPLQELATFMADLEMFQVVPAELRVISRLIQELKLRNEARGRRLMNVALPVNWEKDGHFSIHEDKGIVQLQWVTTNSTLEKRAVPDKVLRGTAFVALQLVMNWSMQSAAIFNGGTGQYTLCSLVFPETLSYEADIEHEDDKGRSEALSAELVQSGEGNLQADSFEQELAFEASGLKQGVTVETAIPPLPKAT